MSKWILCLSFMGPMRDCFTWYKVISKQFSRMKCQKLHNLRSEAESSTTYWKNALEVNLKYTLLFQHQNARQCRAHTAVNVTKSAVSCGFGHIYWGNPWWKTSFFVHWHVWNCSQLVPNSVDPDTAAATNRWWGWRNIHLLKSILKFVYFYFHIWLYYGHS